MKRAAILVLCALVVGAIDLPAAETNERVAQRFYAEPGFDPYLRRAPADCTALGLQWVASSSDGGPWVHTCLEVVLIVPEIWP